MNYKVIATFIDQRNGVRVLPGQKLPEGLDEQAIRRLVRAKCIAPAPAPIKGKESEKTTAPADEGEGAPKTPADPRGEPPHQGGGGTPPGGKKKKK